MTQALGSIVLVTSVIGRKASYVKADVALDTLVLHLAMALATSDLCIMC